MLVITFVVSEGIEMLVAAGVALLFLKPLQAFAENVVSLLMPHTQNTPGYKNLRKAEVYGAAFAEAAGESGVSDKERALLNRLRDSLELTPDEAAAIERKIIA